MISEPREDLTTPHVSPSRAKPGGEDAGRRPVQRFVDRPYEAKAAPPAEVEGVGVDGRPRADESEMAAKCVGRGRDARYYVRYSTTGGDARRPLNPRSLSFRHDEFAADRVVRGRRRYEFREVKPEAYSIYVRSLVEASDGLLLEMERIQNG